MFDDDFMNDMLLNTDLYGLEDENLTKSQNYEECDDEVLGDFEGTVGFKSPFKSTFGYDLNSDSPFKGLFDDK